MATNALKKITTRAKQIRKKSPGKSWKSAVKEAGREYRAGGIAGTKKRKRVSGTGSHRKARKSVSKSHRSVGTKPKYKVIHEVRRINGITYRGGTVRVAGVADVEKAKTALRHKLGEQAGWLDVAISSAKTKPEKNKLRKKKREVIAELNRIK